MTVALWRFPMSANQSRHLNHGLDAFLGRTVLRSTHSSSAPFLDRFKVAILRVCWKDVKNVREAAWSSTCVGSRHLFGRAMVDSLRRGDLRAVIIMAEQFTGGCGNNIGPEDVSLHRIWISALRVCQLVGRRRGQAQPRFQPSSAPGPVSVCSHADIEGYDLL